VQSARVRDINLRYAATIGRALPQEVGAEFTDRFNELVYPRVYRVSTTDRAFETILAFEDLSEEQRGRVLEAKARYEQSRERMDANWARAIAEQEEERDVMRVMGIEPSTEATRETRTARRELDRTAYEQVLQVLTEEQARRLPPPVRRDRGDED
jgi:protein-disulfide isomerase-like protein with CxxC motif